MNAPSTARHQTLRLLQGDLSLAGKSQWVCSRCLAERNKRRKLSTAATSSRASAIGPRNIDNPDRRRSRQDAIWKQQHSYLTRQASKRREYNTSSELEAFSLSSSSIKAFRARLKKAILDKSLTNIIGQLQTAASTPGLLQTIPRTTWSAIIVLANPSRYINFYKQQWRSYSASALAAPSPDGYLKDLASLISLRRECNIDISPSDFWRLLDYSRKLGSDFLANSVWQAMEGSGVTPSPAAFEAYLGATVKSEPTRRTVDYKVAMPTWAPSYSSDIGTQDGSNSARVIEIYKAMLQQKVEPTTASYIAVIIAFARVRDVTGVRDALLNAFGIDVIAIGKGNARLGKELDPATAGRVMRALPEVFGYLDDNTTGLRVIDFLSTHTGIPVFPQVWYSMVRWMWISARNTPRTDLTDPDADPDADLERLQERLFDITEMGRMMQSEPYLAKPEIDLSDLIYRAHGLTNPKLTSASRWQARLDMIRAVRPQYIFLITKFRERLGAYRTARSLLEAGDTTALQERKVENLQIQCEQLRIKKRKYRLILSRWVQGMLPWKNVDKVFDPQTVGGDNSTPIDRWRVTSLPDFLLIWRGFMPSTAEYVMPTGQVRLQLRTPEEDARRKAKVFEQSEQSHIPYFRWKGKSLLYRKGEEGTMNRTLGLVAPDWSLVGSASTKHDEEGLFEENDDGYGDERRSESGLQSGKQEEGEDGESEPGSVSAKKKEESKKKKGPRRTRREVPDRLSTGPAPPPGFDYMKE